jgi:DUF4097 and DUF4098 domain-containing protein YvlB
MEPAMKRLVFLLLPLPACHLGFDRGIVVDGVRLRAQHEEVLDVPEWSPSGLAIEAHQGDIRVESSSGPTTITLKLHEESPGDARAAYEDGVVVARTKSGKPCAIGDVVVRSARPIPGVRISTGMGDVTLREVGILGALHVTTGMGDVDARDLGEPDEIALESGMGSLELENARCAKLSARSGMGDVEIDAVTAGEADVSSGMGDVTFERSSFQRLKANTGMGDIDCVETSYAEGAFETGLGEVEK